MLTEWTGGSKESVSTSLQILSFKVFAEGAIFLGLARILSLPSCLQPIFIYKKELLSPHVRRGKEAANSTIIDHGNGKEEFKSQEICESIEPCRRQGWKQTYRVANDRSKEKASGNL